MIRHPRFLHELHERLHLLRRHAGLQLDIGCHIRFAAERDPLPECGNSGSPVCLTRRKAEIILKQLLICHELDRLHANDFTAVSIARCSVDRAVMAQNCHAVLCEVDVRFHELIASLRRRRKGRHRIFRCLHMITPVRNIANHGLLRLNRRLRLERIF